MKEPTPLVVSLSDDGMVDFMEEKVTDKPDRELCEMSGLVFMAVEPVNDAVSEAVGFAMSMRAPSGFTG
jgi:hypothetical protein